MSDPVKRVQYFDHQFLGVADFSDEQHYHLMMRRLHNQLLHTPGIAQGLTVTLSGSAVTVAGGLAIDGQGREIYLVNPATLDASNLPIPGSAYVTIAYGEQTSDTTTEPGGQGDTRWTEQPSLSLSPALPPDTTIMPVLGKITRAQDGTFTLDTSGRTAAGAIGIPSAPPPPLPADLAAASLSLKADAVPQAQWPKLTCSGVNQAALAGSLTATGAINGQSASIGSTSLTNAGNIISPMFKVSQPINYQNGSTTATISGSFNSSGGTLVLIASGSAMAPAAPQMIGMELLIDNVSKGFLKLWANDSWNHKALISNIFVITGLAASNNHTVLLKPWNNTSTDSNDFFNVTVLELPF